MTMSEALPDGYQPSDLMTKGINNQRVGLSSPHPSGWLITLQVSVTTVGFDNRCRVVRRCIYLVFSLIFGSVLRTFCKAKKLNLPQHEISIAAVVDV